MDGWQKVDSFQMLPDAEFHKAMLEAEGVEAMLRNVHLNTLKGEIPIPETDIELWVRENQVGDARAIFERFQQASPDSASTQWCPQCKEDNPGNFATCWSCQGPL